MLLLLMWKWIYLNLPEATNLDVGVFLDAGNVWGVDYDNSIQDSDKLRSSTGIVANYSSQLALFRSFFLKTSPKHQLMKQKVLTLI